MDWAKGVGVGYVLMIVGWVLGIVAWVSAYTTAKQIHAVDPMRGSSSITQQSLISYVTISTALLFGIAFWTLGVVTCNPWFIWPLVILGLLPYAIANAVLTCVFFACYPNPGSSWNRFAAHCLPSCLAEDAPSACARLMRSWRIASGVGIAWAAVSNISALGLVGVLAIVLLCCYNKGEERGAGQSLAEGA